MFFGYGRAEEAVYMLGAQYAAALDILAVCEKHYPKRDLDAPEMLATAIDYFKLGDEPKNGVPLFLEWTVEAFVGAKLLENLDDILADYKMAFFEIRCAMNILRKTS